MTCPDAVVIRYTPPSARPRRTVFEPLAAGGHRRIEQVWTGDDWRETGNEIVAGLDIGVPGAGACYAGP